MMIKATSSKFVRLHLKCTIYYGSLLICNLKYFKRFVSTMLYYANVEVSESIYLPKSLIQLYSISIIIFNLMPFVR